MRITEATELFSTALSLLINTIKCYAITIVLRGYGLMGFLELN